MPPIDYMDFIFDSLIGMIGAIEGGAKAISAALIGQIFSNLILQIMFAIQTSILVIRFVLDRDGFSLVTDFIRLAAIYMIIIHLLTNWETFGFGFIEFIMTLFTTVLSAASGALSGGTGSFSPTSDPVALLGQMQDQFGSRITEFITSARTLAADIAENVQQNRLAEAAQDALDTGMGGTDIGANQNAPPPLQLPPMPPAR